MFELLLGTSALLGVLLIAAIVFAMSYRDERDEARYDLDHEQKVAQALDNRVITLRGDNIALEREVGRLKAEAMIKTAKRGPDGKFTPKAKPTSPIVASADATHD